MGLIVQEEIPEPLRQERRPREPPLPGLLLLLLVRLRRPRLAKDGPDTFKAAAVAAAGSCCLVGEGTTERGSEVGLPPDSGEQRAIVQRTVVEG